MRCGCRWKHKFSPKDVTQLELGLTNKREGLEAMRRERLPGVRMYDIAEYYYKVRAVPLPRQHWYLQVFLR
jgi:hypothetical protein